MAVSSIPRSYADSSSSLPATASFSNSVFNHVSCPPAHTGNSVSTMVMEGDKSPSSLLTLIWQLILFLVRVIPGALYWLITFTTITLPTWLFTLFSMSLTFTMNFTTLLLIILALVSTISWFVRYRFLNMYSRLPSEPQRKEPQLDLFPDTQEGDSKPGLSSYLDEFLSAIKVFGYLERPVFHELTRTMQTRKLIAGETLLLEEEKGFCLVVDGMVQIFVKSLRDYYECHRTEDLLDGRDGSDSEQHDERHQGYQLLTEVKNGASMSSLFSILSLFTEDIKLRYTDEDTTESSYPVDRTPDSLPNSPGEQIPGPDHPSGPIRQQSHNNDRSNGLQSVPPLRLDPAPDIERPRGQQTRQRRSQSKPKSPKSAHPDIVARAVVDTTIAIIPASAFRRLTRVYPKATAHIVQVILTRLQRVTLATAHSYLGLTSEVLSIEKMMNRYTTYDLPNHLRGTALDRLKDKFMKERERLGAEDFSRGIALHNPSAGKRRRRSSSTLKRELLLQTKLSQSRRVSMMPQSVIPERDRYGVSPGDLLSNIELSRFGPRADPHMTQNHSFHATNAGHVDGASPLAEGEQSPFMAAIQNGAYHRQDSMDEDSIFRESILNCMAKAIGLTAQPNALGRPPNSVEQSPKLVSYDSRRQKAVFNNAFGFIDPYENSTDADSESVMSSSVMSVGGLANSTNISDELMDDIEIVYFPSGAVLVEQGERNPGLYYVLDGFLEVTIPAEEKTYEEQQSVIRPDPLHDDLFLGRSQSNSRNSSIPRRDSRRKSQARKALFMIKPGGIAGYIGTVSSHRSFTDVRARTDVYVGFLPRAALERIVEKYPVVLLTMAKRLTSLLPRLILHIDFALEWLQIGAGQVIHHQGDESDAIYLVLNGRLRSVLERDGDHRVIGEFGQGESVGELEVMTESRRPATLHTIRDTEVAKFPKSLFNSLAQEHTGITIQIAKLVAQRMRALIDDPLFGQGKDKLAAPKNVNSTMNLRTVAILPVTAGVPVVEFGSRLLHALTQIGVENGTTSLNQAAILNHLGRHAFSRMGKLKLSQYLADLEEKYGMVLYIADTNVNAPWTQTCITQADCILLVGLAQGSPNIGEYERFLLGMKTTARKELVLLHAERYVPSGLTRKWLRNRLWINGGHHHIQMPFRTTSEPAHPRTKRFGSALKQRVQVLQAEIQKYTSRSIRQTPLYAAQTPLKGDFHRLARRLCGKSVGLVLGGGGARGMSQIGVIRALEEGGIPIDMVGGTSMGAFIGALYARDTDVVPMYGRAKKFAGRMGSIWRFALDLTYPSASYTTGHEFNRGIFKTFGNSQIEDFWLQFYCNTTNISKSRAEIHTSGYIWRYVRASMSLAGLLPPMCDEGSMLLDGGYIDNLTVAHMQSLGADVIFAVDVGSIDDNTPQQFGDSLSGFWAFINRWNPFSSYPNPPTLSEIQSRLAYVSSISSLERAKQTPGCLYLRPPIDPYGTLDFSKFDEIYQVGYSYGKEFLKGLRDKGTLPVIGEETEEKKNLRRTMAPRRASI